MADRNIKLDFLRSISTLAVVWLHVSASFVLSKPDASNPNWWVGNIADSFSRWCVPVFVMLSGALLLPWGRTEPPLVFYKKRLSRVLIPLLSWTVVYIVFRAFTQPGFKLENAINGLVMGQPYFHLWYVYMIVGLYVFTPFLQVFVSAASRQSLLLLILIAMAIGSIESMLGVISATFLSRFLPYVGYFLVGYYLRESEIGVQTRILFLLAFAFGTLISIGTGLLLPKIGPRSWELMYDYLNPLVVLMSVCVFSIGLRTNLTGPAPIVFSNKIAPLSFGIYLVHPIWLWMSGHYFPWAFSEFPIITIPANTLAIFLLSALSILAISRIPLLRRTV